MDKVTIQNISSATVVISVPDLKLRKELIPGRTIRVDGETYEELTFDPGFNGLIDDHYIAISGIEEEADEVVEKENIFSFKEIEEILDKLDVTAFAKMIPAAKQAEKDTIVKMAVEKGITHPAFVKLIQQYCGVDVINAINREHQLKD